MNIPDKPITATASEPQPILTITDIKNEDLPYLFVVVD
jgi:hypothetical protein